MAEGAAARRASRCDHPFGGPCAAQGGPIGSEPELLAVGDGSDGARFDFEGGLG